MELSALKKLGLSEGEMKIYSALLTLGQSQMGKIAKLTGIERRRIYDVLDKLTERGLVTHAVENKKTLFKASPPNKINSYIEEKENELSEIKTEFNKELPSLMKQYDQKHTQATAEIYSGIEGIKTIWDDMLNHKDIYWIGLGRYVPKQIPTWFKHWNKKRINTKTIFHSLVREELKKEIKILPFEEIKFLPKDFSKTPSVICIYGNNVVNFVYGKENIGFLIKHEELAESYKAYHKYLWDHVAKK